MNVKRLILVVMIVGGLGLAIPLFRYRETTFEFDYINFRSRSCERSRSSLFDWVLSESCSDPEEHKVGNKLRELGVLGPVQEQPQKWALISGFKPGVRGWRGGGRECVRSLGAVTFGTAVTLPADEELSENMWVKWAIEDPESSKRFWQRYRAIALQHDEIGIVYLIHTKEYLQDRKKKPSFREVDAHVSQEVRQVHNVDVGAGQ